MHRTATADPAHGPIVIMLGLFATCQCWVTAVTVDGTQTVWLDLITRTGHRTTPLAVVSEIDTRDPRLTVETFHRHWAAKPEIRWHLLRQSALLYRAYVGDRARPQPHHESETP